MDKYKYLKVFYNDILVGTLAKTPDRVVAFEYDLDWLNNGFSISPFSLPLIKKVGLAFHLLVYRSSRKSLFQNTIHLVVYLEFLTTVCLTGGDDCLLIDYF